MPDFVVGSTVRCNDDLVDESDVAQSPATSLKITIKDPHGNTIVSAEDMTEDGDGDYHYDFQSEEYAAAGEYSALFHAIDGADTSKKIAYFNMVPSI
jgi:5-hydroxyisourate hydrolase-like protein (transthyretin family)